MSFDCLRDFLQRGGEIRIVIPDPREPDGIERVQSQWDSHRERTNLRPSNIANRIRVGLLLVENARLAAKVPQRAVRIYTDSSINYAGYCFDGHDLILVPYAMNNSLDFSPPRFHIDLRIADSVRRFWDNEWEKYGGQHVRSYEELMGTYHGSQQST
jgi:hypothetical protein